MFLMFEKEKEQLLSKYLQLLGLDLNDENFRETSARIVRMHKEMLYGLTKEADDEIKTILSKHFPCDTNDMVVFPAMDLVAMCPHHFLPIRMLCWVAYIPKGNHVIGLSKIPRIVELLSKKPVLQEKLVHDIANCLSKHTDNNGVYVIIEGNHSCMQDRGIKCKSPVVNAAIRGNFKKESTRNEALILMRF